MLYLDSFDILGTPFLSLKQKSVGVAKSDTDAWCCFRGGLLSAPHILLIFFTSSKSTSCTSSSAALASGSATGFGSGAGIRCTLL